MHRRRILIIKLGYSETFIPHVRAVCSLGDVLRTTCVLHLFANDEVTWMTDAAALPLLKGNPLIHRLLAYEPESVRQIEGEHFDAVINLEKVPAVCAVAERMDARVHHGFRLDPQTREPVACDRVYENLVVTTHEQARQIHGRPWAELLYAMLGAAWKGEPYVLGYKPRGRMVHDIGFNTHVGSLMPVKAWPESHWRKLDQLMAGRYTVAYQQSLNDIEGYMEWIHSCRLLVTSDSLGLHLGLAMRKKIVALFGPTPADDVSPTNNLRIVMPSVNRDCMPCLRGTCALGDPCMRFITPEAVRDAAVLLMEEDSP